MNIFSICTLALIYVQSIVSTIQDACLYIFFHDGFLFKYKLYSFIIIILDDKHFKHDVDTGLYRKLSAVNIQG